MITEGDFFLAFDLDNMDDVGLGRTHLCEFLGLSDCGSAVRYRDYESDGSFTESWQDHDFVAERVRYRVSRTRALSVLDQMARRRLEVA